MINRALDKSSPIPLYHQLIQEILKDIRSGVIKPGDPIPTEEELSELFDISRTTIRRAVLELTNEGILEPRRPKGVFVCSPRPIERSNGNLTSFTEFFTKVERIPSTKILSVSQIVPKEHVCKILTLGEGEKVNYIHRLRLLDGAPASISQAYIPLNVVTGIKASDFSEIGFNQSLYLTLENKFNLKLKSAIEEIQAINLSDEESHLLSTSPGHAAILRTRKIFNERLELILYEEATILYVYSNVLTRRKQ